MDRRLLAQALASPQMWLAILRYGIARLAGKPTVILKRNGVIMEVGTGKGQGAWAGIAGNSYEPELLPWLGMIRASDVVVDIGANIGAFSLRAAKAVGCQGIVLSFEPMPDTYQRLLKNITFNQCGNILAIRKAVADTIGKAIIRSSGHHSSASIVNREFADETHVEVTTLDFEIEKRGLPKINVIKMDIEGAEPRAVKGMTRSLRKWKPLILFENGPAGDETASLLSSLGYDIGTYDLHGRWHHGRAAGNLFARPEI